MILVTGMPAMICTLAMQQVLQGITYMITGAAPVYGMPDSVKVLGQGYLWIIPVPVIIMVVCFAIGGFIMKRTYVGRYFYAVGSNPEATRLSGLSVKKIQLLSYLINGFFCGIAGIVMMSRIFSGQPKAGVGFEMDVITACVIGGVAFSGGKGTISGLVEGVLIMGVLSNGLGVKGVDSYTQLVFKGVVLILVVGIDCYQAIARQEPQDEDLLDRTASTGGQGEREGRGKMKVLVADRREEIYDRFKAFCEASDKACFKGLTIEYAKDTLPVRYGNFEEFVQKMEREGPEWIEPDQEVLEKIADADILLTEWGGRVQPGDRSGEKTEADRHHPQRPREH